MSILQWNQHENDDLRAAVDGLAQSVQTLQEGIAETEEVAETDPVEVSTATWFFCPLKEINARWTC